jgi:hypothetical protein
MIGFFGTDYKSSHIELLLNDVCITNLSLISILSIFYSLEFKIEVMSGPSVSRSVGQSASLSWCQEPIWDLDQTLLLSDSCEFVDVGRSL